MSTTLIDSRKVQGRTALIERLKSRELQSVYEKYDVEHVYLFGSYLTGEQREDSDVDLLITFADQDKYKEDFQFQKKIFAIYNTAQEDIESKIQHKVDFVPELFLKKRIRE